MNTPAGMVLLDRAWTFGSPALSAPQATLMKMIVEGHGGVIDCGTSGDVFSLDIAIPIP